MYKVTIWVDFEAVESVVEISNKADIKLTIVGDNKKIDVVSQIDLKSGYEFEFDEYGEYCISLENENFKFIENYIIDQSTPDLEIVIK